MVYIVHARWWHKDLEERFGQARSKHELSDSDIVELIMKFGRCEITVSPVAISDAVRILEFHNDYD